MCNSVRLHLGDSSEKDSANFQDMKPKVIVIPPVVLLFFFTDMVCLCKHVIIHLRHKISSKGNFRVWIFYVQTKNMNHMMKTEGGTDFCSFLSSVNEAPGRIHDINHPELHRLHQQNCIWNPWLLLYFDAIVRLHSVQRTQRTHSAPFSLRKWCNLRR